MKDELDWGVVFYYTVAIFFANVVYEGHQNGYTS